MRRRHGASCREAWTNKLSPARKTREVMERNPAHKNDVIILDERPVDLDRNAAARLANADKPCQIPCVVVDRLYSLGDKGRQYLLLFIFGDGAMNAGRKDDRDISRMNSVLN